MNKPAHKILVNKYVGKSLDELKEVFREKKTKYDSMMKVLKPISYGMEFLDKDEIPIWVRIAHIDEFLECPYCLEEYQEKLKKMN